MNSRTKLMGTIAVGAALLIVPIGQASYGDDPAPSRLAAIVSTVPSSAVRPDDRAGLRRVDDAGAAGASGTGYVVPAGGTEAIVNDGVVPIIRPDDRSGVRGPGSAPVYFTAAATSDGFDWIDALIGGVGGIATALLFIGGAFLLLSQRNRTRTA